MTDVSKAVNRASMITAPPIGIHYIYGGPCSLEGPTQRAPTKGSKASRACVLHAHAAKLHKQASRNRILLMQDLKRPLMAPGSFAPLQLVMQSERALRFKRHRMGLSGCQVLVQYRPP